MVRVHKMRAMCLLALSRLCAADLWLLRRATDIVSAGKPEYNAARDKQRDVYLASRLSHFTPGYHAPVFRVDTSRGTVGYTVPTSSMKWSGMTCNYYASDGSIKSTPLD